MVLVMFKCEDNYYIQCNREDNSIMDVETVGQALTSFRRAYSKAMQASIILQILQFSPAIITVKDMDELKEIVGESPYYTTALRGESAFYFGMEAKGTRAKEFHDGGVIPK